MSAEDKNRSEWKRIEEFQVEMSTERLNLDQLYQEADNFGAWIMPENTVIGHIHLHVSNLSESKKFYSEILGLHHTCTFPGAYFFAADMIIIMWQPIHGLALIVLKN
jgi:catechol 2,3-dioxygenase